MGDLDTASVQNPVFITSLPRAGTTLLLEVLAAVPGLVTHTYRDMPFVLCPMLWNRVSQGMRKESKLRLKRNSVVGTNPFETHGAALVDIQSGGFGGDAALASGDFEASATATAVATLSNAANNGDWSEGVLDATGLSAINRAGLTQLRVYFSLDDNDDLASDIIRYFSGNDGNPDNHPQFVVTYQ